MSQLRLRPATPADDDFERALFVSARGPELAVLPEERRAPLLEMQFRAQRATFAGRVVRIAEREGRRVARVVTGGSRDELHLVDLVVDPAARGEGLGSDLVAGLQRDARRVVLEVRRDRPELVAWYRRLGFEPTTGGDELTLKMAWARPEVDRRTLLAGAAVGAAALAATPAGASARANSVRQALLRVTPLDVSGIRGAELRARTPGGPSFIVWGMRDDGGVRSVGATNEINLPYGSAPEFEVEADGRVWTVRPSRARVDLMLDGRWPLTRRAGERPPSRPALRVELLSS